LTLRLSSSLLVGGIIPIATELRRCSLLVPQAEQRHESTADWWCRRWPMTHTKQCSRSGWKTHTYRCPPPEAAAKPARDARVLAGR
jgi:hypothetical protein